MTITTLPAAPLVTDDTPTFNTKAFALAGALATLVSQINAAIALNNITSAADIHAAPAKTALVDADEAPWLNSATGFSLVNATLGNLKTALAAWLNGGTIPASVTTLAASGNAAFGTTPLATLAGQEIVAFGPDANLTAENSDGAGKSFHFSQNASVASGAWLRIAADAASNYYQTAGTHTWRVTASGAAGSAITWITAMSISATGTAIDFVTSGTVLTVGVGANNGTVSAGVFTDRTKAFTGDALTEIAKITHTDGEIDHSTLPVFAQVELVKPIYEAQEIIKIRDIDGVPTEYTETTQVKIGEYTATERDIGAMVSMFTVAVQQLTARLAALEK